MTDSAMKRKYEGLLERVFLKGGPFYAIHLHLVPGRAVAACTSIYSGSQIIEECLSAATYREHTLPFVLEVAKRITRLAVSLSEAPSEPVATQWGRIPVVIAPPDRVLEVFLPDR